MLRNQREMMSSRTNTKVRHALDLYKQFRSAQRSLHPLDNARFRKSFIEQAFDPLSITGLDPVHANVRELFERLPLPRPLVGERIPCHHRRPCERLKIGQRFFNLRGQIALMSTLLTADARRSTHEQQRFMIGWMS
jgi:hypothetical protein